MIIDKLLIFFWIFVDLEILIYSIKVFKKYVVLEWVESLKNAYMWKTNILTMSFVFVIIDFLYMIIEYFNRNLSTLTIFINILWRIVIWRVIKYWLNHKDIFHTLLRT